MTECIKDFPAKSLIRRARTEVPDGWFRNVEYLKRVLKNVAEQADNTIIAMIKEFPEYNFKREDFSITIEVNEQENEVIMIAKHNSWV